MKLNKIVNNVIKNTFNIGDTLCMKGDRYWNYIIREIDKQGFKCTPVSKNENIWFVRESFIEKYPFCSGFYKANER